MGDMRLIDANALEKALHEKVKTLADENGLHDHYVSGFDDAITYVENAPTIDAVEVVRCRECKYARPLYQEGCVVCILWSRTSALDGFCHKGAKMDGGAEG